MVSLEGLENISTAKSRRFPRLSRDLTFVSKLAVSLAKPSEEIEFELGK